ncbi:MAG: hypothetical protein M3N04_06205, partial [Actinomycetota bacterium]|nr:hypothetical protein [Actinomycetota bacterium]
RDCSSRISQRATMNFAPAHGLHYNGTPTYGDDPMPSSDRSRLARACYEAYETGDRQALENVIADDFAFWSPQDDGIDRTTYFERCWPNHKRLPCSTSSAFTSSAMRSS